MHKILVRTELVQLRKLGYEVFNPPYLSSVRDQSAHLDWDKNQPTTLPKEVFDKLANYNFFYNHISEEISGLLNAYFDAVIVTIHPDWLLRILKSYQGKLIYRTYGQTLPLSGHLYANGSFSYIESHKDFYFSPHAEEVMDGEHSWLRERSVVIPYCLTEDVIKDRGTYDLNGKKSGTVAVTCPNIKDRHYFAHYKILKKNLPAETYKFYGVQLEPSKDPQVVGTLSREELTRRFLASNAYLYTYTNPQTCYLPPIEMMIFGGPVVYLRGSLLDKYYRKDPSPGRAESFEEAKSICNRLLNGDLELASSIIASQKKIFERYDPDHVWPVFDREMGRMLTQKPRQFLSPLAHLDQPNKKPVIVLFHHFPEVSIQFDGVNYFGNDEVSRSMKEFVKTLLETEKYSVKISARRNQVQNFYGFFKLAPEADLQILCVEDRLVQKTPVVQFIGKVIRFALRKLGMEKIYKQTESLPSQSLGPVQVQNAKAPSVPLFRRPVHFALRKFKQRQQRLYSLLLVEAINTYYPKALGISFGSHSFPEIANLNIAVLKTNSPTVHEIESVVGP
jgi:hypothetical protein